MPQGTPGAVELRLVYLEFELERRLVGHERVLKTFLESSGSLRCPSPLEAAA